MFAIEKDLIKAATERATENERERCAAIIQAARFGEVDSDLRSILSMIECGKSIEELRSQ